MGCHCRLWLKKHKFLVSAHHPDCVVLHWDIDCLERLQRPPLSSHSILLLSSCTENQVMREGGKVLDEKVSRKHRCAVTFKPNPATSVTVTPVDTSCKSYFSIPKWHSGKESSCPCRRHKRCRFDPWAGKVPWRRKWQPTPVFLPGKFRGQKSLVGYSP